MLEYILETKYSDEGYSVICGTDEAGRGPLAGPVFAAACILPAGLVIDGLNDSKKISEKKREKLFDIICREAVSYGIASASVEEIDSINILEAAQLAMRRAVAMLTPVPDLVLVDGNIARGFEMKAVPVIGGDALSPSIAAASILAKVSRDRDCILLDEKYPEYGFAKHKGYPTKEHRQKVFELGPCPDHRKTFLGFLQKMK
ncbi:MAG: ribonuclease HII [Clostridia bacterium]|nr:ribonuclease HII [Clostridia bacterium]